MSTNGEQRTAAADFFLLLFSPSLLSVVLSFSNSVFSSPFLYFFSPVNTHSVSSLHVPIPHSVIFHPPCANSNSLSSLFLHVPNTITKLSTLGLPRGRQKFSPLLACHVASIFYLFLIL